MATGTRSGKEIDRAGRPFEKQVQEATGGKPEIIEGREIDGVTDEALIQAKDTETAATKPHNFTWPIFILFAAGWRLSLTTFNELLQQ